MRAKFSKIQDKLIDYSICILFTFSPNFYIDYANYHQLKHHNFDIFEFFKKELGFTNTKIRQK